MSGGVAGDTPYYADWTVRDTEMIAIIFEVWPADGRRQEYLDIAASLRPLLEEIDGFISIERFESLAEPGKILSLSFFRDEQAVAEWRALEAHRKRKPGGVPPSSRTTDYVWLA